MTSVYTDIQIRPSLSEWSDMLAVCELNHARLDELRRTARTRLIESAQKYVLKLNSIADDTELPANVAPVLTGDPATQPIVMTGHQPVLFHSGLTFKYETTQQFAADNNAIAVGVIIDTDRGDAGQFSYPEPDPDSNGGDSASAGDASAGDDAAAGRMPVRQGSPYQARLAVQSLAESNSLFTQGKLKSATDLQALATEVQQALRQLSQPAAARTAFQVLSGFGQLSTTSATAMEANTIMRWQFGIGSRMLELPLSAIAAFPESLMLTVDILKQPRRFASAYNSALSLFREEQGIRNSANPFPDLKITDDGCELPFWVVNHNRGTRHVLDVQLDGNVTRLLANGRTVDTFADSISDDALEPMLLQSLQIVPRGALITVFLRLLFSDLFVHGTGGGRYDRFTDEFIRTWWNVEPPPFTVASASRYLFGRQREELQRLGRIRSQLRDLQFNPQRYFGQGIFSDELEERLADLVQEKDVAVQRLQSAHASGQSARDSGRDIQQFTNQIKEAVAAEFEPQFSLLNALTPEQHDAINSRTYPWFFFDDDERDSTPNTEPSGIQ
ncbi:MAG: hypothetical protein R3C59_25655 [Planctomycetaceae bacterium]